LDSDTQFVPATPNVPFVDEIRIPIFTRERFPSQITFLSNDSGKVARAESILAPCERLKKIGTPTSPPTSFDLFPKFQRWLP
jgi:hypothetical protein